MIQLALNNIKKSYGVNDILKNVTFEVRDRDRIGIVGENGCGKTTLFKTITGEEELDGGIISKGTKNIGYLEQIPNYDQNLKVSQIIKFAFSNIYKIEEEMHELEEKMQKEVIDSDLKKYSKLQEKYELQDGYKTTEKYNRICKGLKFTDEFVNKKFSVLSGGEKTIALLAKILLENHNLLLLDEPTNHLDMESIKWLEEYLNEYDGAVVIISHDRYFLDKVVNKIVEIDDGISTLYDGNYTNFTKLKEEKEIQLFEQYKSQQKIIKAMKESIHRLREYGAVSKTPEKFYKRAKAIQKRLDSLEKIEKPKEKNNIKLNLVEGSRSGNEVIKAKKITKKYDDKIIFDKASLDIYYKEKVALIGNNGAGKTTFIKCLLGKENLEDGKLILGSNTSIGYLEQQVKFENEEETVLDYFRDGYKITEEDARKYLAKFMFYGETVYKTLESLSGGERSRIRLAKMIYSNINFLILDEPTNHLDIYSIEVLEEALLNYKGTILIVSHDRYFIDKIANKIIELKDGKFNSYIVNYTEYLEKTKKEESLIKEKTVKNVVKKERVKYRSEKDILKDIDKVQDKLNKKEEEIKNIDKEIGENISDYIKVQELVNKKEVLENEQEELLNKWYELEEEVTNL